MEVVTIQDIVNFIIKKWYVAIVVAILVVLLGILYSAGFKKPIYEAEIASVLNITVPTQENVSVPTDAVVLNRELLYTYIEIIQSEKVANQVIQTLQLEETATQLKGKIELENTDNAQFITIRVTDTDKQMALQIANTIMQTAKQEIQQLYGMDALTILEDATIVSSAENIHMLKDIALYIVVGFVLAGVWMAVYYYIDDTIKNTQTIQNVTGLPIIGRMADLKTVKNKAEIDCNLQNVMEVFLTEGKQCVGIISPERKDGKTMLAQKIVQQLVKEHKKVLWIKQEYPKGEKRKEAWDVLQWKEIAKTTQADKASYSTFMQTIREKYDCIILDCMPVMHKDFRRQIVEQLDGVILVATVYTTKIQVLKHTKETVEKSNTPIIGMVLNRVDRNFEGYYKMNERT